MRQITPVAFLQAQNGTTIPASWRHPEARTDTTNRGVATLIPTAFDILRLPAYHMAYRKNGCRYALSNLIDPT